ncbi:MAG TPA: YkgJ family cysteine cluster protein [Anaerolineales bacterium]|nr:YkgJ family cysteine cluster protein [Anaerolineales bacterium]
MHGTDKPIKSPGNTLCKSCGLCCTGHLFIWAKLRSVELEAAEALGLKVIREPRQRGFNQPCPLWDGQCTVYTSPQYPHFCRTYKCKLLKRVLDETTALTEALPVIEQAKDLIHELEMLLPASTNPNFRERLVAEIEHLEKSEAHTNAESEFLVKAQALLIYYEEYFGVKDLVEGLGEE